MESIKELFSEKEKPIRGVVCDVKSCSHNNGNCACTASQITVGPSGAHCCSDTVCATYRPRKTDS